MFVCLPEGIFVSTGSRSSFLMVSSHKPIPASNPPRLSNDFATLRAPAWQRCNSAAYCSWGTKEMSTLTTNSLVHHAQLRLFNGNWLINAALLQHHEQKPGKSPEDWKFSSSLLPTFTHLPPKWNGLLSFTINKSVEVPKSQWMFWLFISLLKVLSRSSNV